MGAIIQLTRIAQNLTSRKVPDLDQVLDAEALPASSDSAGLGSGRKSAAAMRFLVKTFEDNPKAIYEVLERRMQQDYGHQPGVPSSGTCTARAWLCSRSRMQNYHNHVRWSWQTAGILDNLISGQYDRARARAGLLLAAADQASIDNGSWVVSTVGLLEQIPPYQEFSKHSLPRAAESQITALYDLKVGGTVPHGIEGPGVLERGPPSWPRPKGLEGLHLRSRIRGSTQPEAAERRRQDWQRPQQGQGRRKWFGRAARGVTSGMNSGGVERAAFQAPHLPFSPGPGIAKESPTFGPDPAALREPRVPEPGRPVPDIEDAGRHVPGSCVGPVDPLATFRLLPGLIFSSPGPLKTFAKSSLRRPWPPHDGGESYTAPRAVWPVPLPYVEVTKVNPFCISDGDLRKVAVNAAVILLNFLTLGGKLPEHRQPA